MQLIMFQGADGIRLGAHLPAAESENRYVVDLRMLMGDSSWVPNTVVDVLQAPSSVREDMSDRIKNIDVSSRQGNQNLLIPVSDVRLVSPLSNRPFIVGAMGNYLGHRREMRRVGPAGASESVESSPPAADDQEERGDGTDNHSLTHKGLHFIKVPQTVTGPDAEIRLPALYPDMVDFEGELGVVIGRRCFNVSAEEAEDYIGGYTVVNDVSARNWVVDIRTAKSAKEFHYAWHRNILGKQFPTFCPVGPGIVTPDEVGNPHSLELRTTLNGNAMQVANTADLILRVPDLIEEISRFYRLEPGDLIATGTPPGVGIAQKPPVFLREGDVVEVSIERIGTLRNPVAREG